MAWPVLRTFANLIINQRKGEREVVKRAKRERESEGKREKEVLRDK